MDSDCCSWVNKDCLFDFGSKFFSFSLENCLEKFLFLLRFVVI